MTTSRLMRGLAVLATGSLLWGFAASPASADNIRDGQWALQNYGAADRVWPIAEGDGVTVAVIDTGVADHQDLTGQVLPGGDFSGSNSDGRVDTQGHGTGMASVIAGHGHGTQAGVMGLAPKVKILPVKVSLADPDNQPADTSMQTDIASAIRFATGHGAKVISMSIVAGSSAEARKAVREAVDKDVVLVAGTGNSGGAVAYPAAFPGVVAVGAVDQRGNLWDRSNRGPEVTLVAPGVDIYRADSKSSTSYARATGTSDATAYVAAIAALVRSKYPNLSAGQVIERMIKSAVAPSDKSSVPNDRYGYGIASAAGSLAANPAVDSGPKDNPLLTRQEADRSDGNTSASAPAPGGSSATSKSGGSNTVLSVIGGGVLVLVLIVLVVVLAVRSRNNNRSGGGGHGGGPGAPGAYPYPPQGPPQQAYRPQYPPQQYSPQQQPPSGNPYQR